MTFFYPYSNFDNVIRLVLERMQKIPKHNCILFWHHILLHAYHYLFFKKL